MLISWDPFKETLLSFQHLEIFDQHSPGRFLIKLAKPSCYEISLPPLCSYVTCLIILCPALETINSGWFTPLTQSIKPNYLVFSPTDATPQFLSLETYPVTIDHLPSHFFSAARIIALASLSAFTITTVLFYWSNRTLTFSAFSWMLHNHTTGVLTHWIHHYTLGTVCFAICAAHRGVLSCTYSVTCAFILTRFLVFHTLSKWMTGWYAN